MSSRFPGAVAVRTYDEYVGLYLNLETVRVRGIADVVEAVRVGTGRARFPRAWLPLVSDNPEDQSAWRATEIELEQ